SIIQDLKSMFDSFKATYLSTLGYPANKVISTAQRVILRETYDGCDAAGLEYLRASAQAMVDSSGTRVLPWIVLLTIASLSFDSLVTKVFASSLSLLTPNQLEVVVPMLRLVVALVAVYFAFNVAHRTYIDVAILQAVSKIQQRGRGGDMKAK